MGDIFFKKYIGSCCGNSFVILDSRDISLSSKKYSSLAKKLIRLYKVDSVLFLLNDENSDIAFRIFEKDGSESDSCGNGTLLITHLLKLKKGKIKVGNNFYFVSSTPKKVSIAMDKEFSTIKKDENGGVFVKFGEPHLIFFVDKLKKFNLRKFGRGVQPQYANGVNVDILEKVSDYKYRIETYERGVFNITKSCGTGSLSSYLALGFSNDNHPVEFKSAGGVHVISQNDGRIKLETFKNFCKVKILKER